MKGPHIDNRTKKDLIEYIKKAAPYYAPQWRFDEEDLDMGSILSLIYVNMFKETLDRFNEVPYKNFITFLNIIDGRLNSSIPAEGYITFKLVKGIEQGILVNKGEKIGAENSASSRLFFETVNNVFVTPSEIKYIYNCSYDYDRIIQAFSYEDEHNNEIKLFNKEGENLQKHEFTINNKDVLNVIKKGIINICIDFPDDVNAEEILDKLCDLKKNQWSFYINDEYVPIKKIYRNEKSIEIVKDFENEVPIINNTDSENEGTIKCVIKDAKDFKNLNISTMYVMSRGKRLVPDIIYANDIEADNRGLFPFNERFSVYNDFYISCREVFLKKGSHINMDFLMEFIKVPIENYDDDSINWKYIMRKDKFQRPVEYEISINEVIWEYWNGIGWAKLKLKEDGSRIFTYEDSLHERKMRIEFECPEDFEETVVNSSDGLFMRIRVLKVNNAYMTRGWYMTPFLKNIQFSYEYKQPHMVKKINVTNNMVEKKYEVNQILDKEVVIPIVEKLSLENSAAYFAFDLKPEGSPIKILFSLKSVMPYKMPALLWEYWNGTEWKALSIIDETENMRKSGIVSFLGEDDFEKKTIFGKEMYWIRIYNLSRQYENVKKILPEIKGMYINTTSICQNDTQSEEIFFIDSYEKNKNCKLLKGNVNKIEVWVNEAGKIKENEYESFPKKNIKLTKNSMGEVEAVWVKWTEVNDFTISNENDRHYVTDRNEGIVYFGDNINGKIPCSQNEESIKIFYSVGGGEAGNLEAYKITNMAHSIGYINKAFNPLASCGGCDMETIDEAVLRSPYILKHRNKAVTIEDYEILAKEASRNISKVKCFSGINKDGEKEHGAITLVIFPKGNLGDDLYFYNIKERVYKYLEERNFSMLNKREKFNIISPCFVDISVKVEAEADEMDNVFSVKQEIEETIKKFVDPITGNFHGQGWNIGELPVRVQILNSLKNLKHINKVINVIVSASLRNKGTIEDIDITRFNKRIYAMPLNGQHKVHITVKQL